MKITPHDVWIVKTLAEHVDTQHPGGIQMRRDALDLMERLAVFSEELLVTVVRPDGTPTVYHLAEGDVLNLTDDDGIKLLSLHVDLVSDLTIRSWLHAAE